MSNKLIKVGESEKKPADPLEVYRDIDIVAADNPGRKPTYLGYWYDLRSSDDEQAPDGITTEEGDGVVIRLQASNEDVYNRQMEEFNKRRFAVSRLANVKAVQNSIRNIFTWLPGERIINPEFGSNIRKMLYNGITPQTSEAIVAEIKHSISQWEPRVKVQKVVNVSDVTDTENNTIHIRIIYTIPALSDAQFWYDYTYHREADD